MRIVVTGAAGFLGRRLVREILRRGSLRGTDGTIRPIERLILLDSARDDAGPADARVAIVTGEVADASVLARLITPDTDGIFHLAALTSGAAERDFDGGWRSNLDGTRALLEACRRLPHQPRFVFASSIAVYGGALEAIVPDDVPLRPQISYGAQKAIGELLVTDSSRKGFIDGRSLRLPTVIVRPRGPGPAAANSDFVSAILREPLAGRDYACPVAPNTPMTLLSVECAIAALIHGYELPPDVWGGEPSVMLPTLDVPIVALAEALHRAAGDAAFRRLGWRPDPAIGRLVAGWPKGFAGTRGRALGFAADDSADAIVAGYLRERSAGVAEVTP